MRNLKILYINHDYILNILSNWKQASGIKLPIIKNLPEGSQVLSVYYCLKHQAFGLVIEHESFLEVPIHMEIPAFEENAMFEYVELPNVPNPTAGPIHLHSSSSGDDSEHSDNDDPRAA